MPAWVILLLVGVFALPIAQRETQAGPTPVPEHIAAVAAEQKQKLAALEKKLAETTQDLEDEKAEDDKKGLKELVEG